MDYQESRSKRAAAQNAGASIAEQFGRYKRKRSEKADDNEGLPRPTEEAAQSEGVSKRRKIKSSSLDVAINEQSDQDQADVAGANMKKQSTKSTRKMTSPASASGQQQKPSKAKQTVYDSSDDTSDHDEEPEQGEPARASFPSKEAGKAKRNAGKSRLDATAADQEVQSGEGTTRPVTAIYTGRPALEQVYTSMRFKTSPEDNEDRHKTDKLGAFCFVYNPKIARSHEPVFAVPQTHVEHVDHKTFLVITKPPGAKIRQKYFQQLAAERKTNPITGEPMLNPKSRDFVKEFRERYHPSRRSDSDRAQAEADGEPRSENTLSEDEETDGMRPDSAPTGQSGIGETHEENDGVTEGLQAMMEARRESQALMEYEEARYAFMAEHSQLVEE